MVDGVKYEEYSYSTESELENSIKYHAKDIFGEDSIFFDKKQLTSLAGIGSVPDGFIVDFKNKIFRIVEVEMSSHDVYGHIVSQLTKFINGMRNPSTHKKIVGSIDDEIKKQPELRKKVKETISGEIYRFLDDLIPEQNPSVVVVIDRKTDELDEARGVLPADVKVVEFRTFVRENVGDLRVHAHVFEPIAPRTISIKKFQKPEAKRKIIRGRKTPDKAYFMPLLETLIEMGGRGKTKDVVDKIGEKMKDKLTDFDMEILPSGTDIRWRNTAKWARNTLKELGLLKRDSPRGIWEISEKGRKYYEKNKG
jgi:hypothetical protein